MPKIYFTLFFYHSFRKTLLYTGGLLFFYISMAQEVSNDSFSIQLAKLEYIDPITKDLVILTENFKRLNKIELTQTYNYIGITFPLSKYYHGDPKHIDYYYKLSKGEDIFDWTFCEHEVRLVGLSPGVHKLSIIGKLTNGNQSKNIIELDIMVPYPFYLQWWFIMVTMASLIIISIWLRFLLIKTIKLKRNRDLHISNLEARAYRAQMNPHFIFNALNGMQHAMLLKGEKEFNRYVTRFSKLIRNTIDMSNVERITLEEELSYLTNYVELQSLSLEKDIFFNVTLDENINPKFVFLPCMMLQPIVENSIVHGLSEVKSKNIITINFSRTKIFLICKINDNGIGRKAAEKKKTRYKKSHKSFATKIMKERINIFNYYNKYRLEFSIEDLKDDKGDAIGTSVTLKIPFDFKFREKAVL